MDGFFQILILCGILLCGALLARLRIAPPSALVDRAIKLVLWALLLVMGFRLGNDRSIAARLGEIGLLALLAAACAVLGSILAILAGYAILGAFSASCASPPRPAHDAGFGPQDEYAQGYGAGRIADWRAPLALLSIVIVGFVLGLALPPLKGFDPSQATSLALYALLFLIGMQFVQAGVSLKGVFFRPETLMVPLATALGSLAGSAALIPLFGLGIGKALSLGAGFGWYSLSGVIIADLGDSALGSAAFLANMARESIAFVAIPLLAKSRFPGLAIGVAGATAMDVTLPLIEQCSGPEAVPTSFASGAILSLSVPILVPLLFRIG